MIWLVVGLAVVAIVAIVSIISKSSSQGAKELAECPRCGSRRASIAHQYFNIGGDVNRGDNNSAGCSVSIKNAVKCPDCGFYGREDDGFWKRYR